jgi:hypothetical protein
MSSSNDGGDVDNPSKTVGQPAKGAVSKFAGIIVSRERVFDVVSTVITAIFTVVLAVSTALLWKETKDLRNFAQEQSNDMKASIAEAARAATAMRDVANAVSANAKAANESLAVFKDANTRQMRAYLAVGLGGVVKQDTTTNYRFEVRMTLQNVGNTPAYKVVTNTQVDVLPFPLPQDFQLPPFVETGSSANVGPHQNFIMTGVAGRIYSDDEINEIQFGSKKRLYVYGRVHYEDAFGVVRQINFCQAILWLKNDAFMSLNTANNNDAN